MKNAIMNSLLLFCSIIYLTGCVATTHYLNDGVSPYQPTNPGKIMVYSDRSSLAKDFIEIGYVSVHITNAKDGDELKAELRNEASAIGADAIINFRIYGLTAGGIAVKLK